MSKQEQELIAVGLHPSQGGWTQEEWNKQRGGELENMTDEELDQLAKDLDDAWENR